MTGSLAVGIIVTKTIILLLGSLITYLSYKAYRRTQSAALRALAIGFGIITLGALFAGGAHQLLGISLTTGLFINSIITMLGFVIITYSLYIE
jgi:heme/copper-type cytochrome/quinol oxidase subunit 3